MKLALRRSGVWQIHAHDGSVFTTSGEPAIFKITVGYRQEKSDPAGVCLIEKSEENEETWTIEVPSAFVSYVVTRLLRNEIGAAGVGEIVDSPESDASVVARAYAAQGVTDDERLRVECEVRMLEAERLGIEMPELPVAVDSEVRESQDRAWAVADELHISLARRAFLERETAAAFRRIVGEKVAKAVQEAFEYAIDQARRNEEKLAGVTGLPFSVSVPRRSRRGRPPRRSLGDFLAFAAENLRTGRSKVDQFADTGSEDTAKSRHDAGKRAFDHFRRYLHQR